MVRDNVRLKIGKRGGVVAHCKVQQGGQVMGDPDGRDGRGILQVYVCF